MSLELSNGSRVLSLPGKEATVRGFANVALLIIDEGARVGDDLYQSVRPMLAVSRGRVVALSTPAGSRGWFWEAATARDTDWHRAVVTADQCPRLSPAWLAAERLRVGRWWFAQEYECQFLDAETALYATADILACVAPDVRPLFPRGSAA